MDSLNGTVSGSIDPVSLANKLLRQCNSTQRVWTVDDIRSGVFIDLYTGFLAESPIGLIKSPITEEDEVHNCQIVIDQLATNLHTSLSHIRGRAIIEGDPVVIQNLLEIIAMLADIILNKIDSDISVDMDDTHSGHFIPSNNVSSELSSREVRWDDPIVPSTKAYTAPVSTLDRVTQRLARTAPDRFEDDSPVPVLTEKPKGVSSKLFEKSSDLLERASDLLRRSRDLNLEHLKTGDKSPPPSVKQNTWVSPGRLDTTDDLVREGRKIQKDLENTKGPLYRQTENGAKPKTSFDHLGVRPKMMTNGVVPDDQRETTLDKSSGTQHRTITHHLYHYYPSHRTDFSASAPLPKQTRTPEKDKLRSTVGPVQYDERSKPPRPTTSTATTTSTSSRPLPAKGLASSYTDLQSLVTQTAAYVRAAVRTSPVRSRLDQDLLGQRTTVPDPLSEYRVPSRTVSSEDLHLARDLNPAPQTKNRLADGVTLSARTSPSAASRKVSFHPKDKSFGSSDLSLDEKAKQRSEDDDVELIRVDIHRKPRSGASRGTTLPVRAGERYGSYTDLGYLSDTELDNGKRDARIRKRFHKTFEGGSKDVSRASSRSRKPKSVPKQVRFESGRQKSPVTSTNRVPVKTSKPKKKVTGVLIDTRQHLLKENKTQKKKTQILKKMYEEDLDDLSEEYKEQMGRNRKEAKDTENEFKKKVLRKPKSSVVKKTEVTIKVVPSKKAKMASKPTVASKVRKHSTGSRGPKRTVSVTDDDDLMPILLEEFPHLYLSEHTWHELWRRGINQIDTLTRTYAENKRKKSHAQVQVEDAGKRHDILVNLVKKQLEHSKRLEEIKDQRSAQASVQNKLHEKRMQSARARKYYNEYQVRMRAKMLRRRTREEMIFKKLFDECLAIQKERIHEVRRYAKEQREGHTEQRTNEIVSMENYYKDQFSMLAERVAKERKDTTIRERAQQKMMDGMKKELRRKMEREIKGFQEQMFRDEDDAYFRQLDADSMRHGLQLAQYQTKV